MITSARALGSLSRLADQVSLQQAILGGALAAGHFAPGARTALITAQAQQASDLGSFRSLATPEEGWAVTQTLASPLAGQAQAVEQRATASGGAALALGPGASQQWQTGMSFTEGWMRHAQQQMTTWIAGYAQATQRSMMRTALITRWRGPGRPGPGPAGHDHHCPVHGAPAAGTAGSGAAGQ